MSHDAACAQLLLHINESNMRHESKAIPFTEQGPKSDVQISSKFPVEKKQARKKIIIQDKEGGKEMVKDLEMVCEDKIRWSGIRFGRQKRDIRKIK